MTRKTCRYHFKMGNRILYSGVTKDLEKRERELKQELEEDGDIKQVGGATTMDTARLFIPTWPNCLEPQWSDVR